MSQPAVHVLAGHEERDDPGRADDHVKTTYDHDRAAQILRERLPPGLDEQWLLCAAHTDADLSLALDVFAGFLDAVAGTA